MKQEDTSNALEEGKYAAPLRLPRPEQKYAKKDGASWRNMKLLFCFLGLQVSYVLWGLAQEYLMTKTYSAGKFKSSAFCVFGNRFLALLISLGIVMFRRFTAPKPITEAPYYYYAPSSLSNTLSSWAQYESLKYISFPTQVLAKSCKIIPVMLVGILLNKKTYPTRDYIESFLITLGVTMFSISERNSPTEPHDDSSYGFMLLALYLACDSFTSQWQSRVYKQYHVDQYQMMLGVNVWSMLMTGFTLYQSGEFFTSFAFILADPQA
ncbi:UAA transporter, partial [Ochromonadaceae sp. CCMP2298]